MIKFGPIYEDFQYEILFILCLYMCKVFNEIYLDYLNLKLIKI